MNAVPNNNEMLLREYDICNKEALRLESNIWHTAVIFSIGSGAGLTYFVKEFMNSKGNYIELGLAVSVFAFFTIIISLVWWRMAKRWWSIQHLKYERMREIEKDIGFKQCSMVRERDNEAMQHIKSYRFIYFFRYKIPKDIIPAKSKEIDRIKNYEHRGIRAVMPLLLWSNAVLWIFLILISSRTIMMHYRDLFSTIIFLAIILIILFIYFWRKP